MSTNLQLFMQAQIPKHWYLFSTYHTQYLYLVPCCTCCCNVNYFCIYNLDQAKLTTIPSTSCRSPLCPIPHKVFRNHAAYSCHLKLLYRMFALHTNRMVCHCISMSSSIITRGDNKHQITCAIAFTIC